MNSVRIAALGAFGLFLILPGDLAAQGRARGHDKQEEQVERKDPEPRELDRAERVERIETRRVESRESRRDGREADRRRGPSPVTTERVVIRDDTGRLLYRDRGREILLLERDVDDRYRVRESPGPAFCRSGAGHPVHGRVWCLEKGFGLGRAGEFFFDGDDTVFYHDGDEIVVVRDSRLDRDRSVWERVVDAMIFWRD